MYITKHCKRLNKTIKYVLDYKESTRIPKINYNPLRIKAYCDAAFTNNADLSSQPGRIAFLTDGNHNSIPVSYKSYKSRRVGCSILSAEVIAFADLFDDAFAIRKQLEFVLRQSIPVHILTDVKSLFNIISRGSRTSEKRNMLDTYAVRPHIKNKK